MEENIGHGMVLIVVKNGVLASYPVCAEQSGDLNVSTPRFSGVDYGM